jgi:truncated hemoglobin YjbI
MRPVAELAARPIRAHPPTRPGRDVEGPGFMPAHLKLRHVDAEHLARWLPLFRQTVDERCPPEAADVLFDIAARMGETIQIGLDRRA